MLPHESGHDIPTLGDSVLLGSRLPNPPHYHEESMLMELITGAEILVRCLKEEGVECMFGYPGGAVLHI